MNTAVVRVQELEKRFPLRGKLLRRSRRYVHAVDGVTFDVPKGRTFGLVGESGSGKSTVGGCILRLLTPDGGRVLFKGTDMAPLEGQELRKLRRQLSVVFQDPQSSLDPRMSIKNIVGAPLAVNGLARGRELEERVAAQLSEVGLAPEHMTRYPHEFSGGQRQRIGLARALVTDPDFIVLDEPTSALDVSVQAQILNMLHELQTRRAVAYLFISHDLTVVRHVSHHIGVMYCGALVEHAPTQELFDSPLHPYTRALLAAVPLPDPANVQNLAPLSGDVPSPVDLPAGCRFHPRCPQRMEMCASLAPPCVTPHEGRSVVCHLYA